RLSPAFTRADCTILLQVRQRRYHPSPVPRLAPWRCGLALRRGPARPQASGTSGKRMPTRVLLSLAAVLCAAAAATCGGQADDAPPVATPSVTFAKSRVPLGSPVDTTFRFE